MTSSRKREVDAVSGIETTGHEWDGIKELNQPLPRWWLYTFYACILWSIGYWIVYPAWPTLTGYTLGIWGYSQRATIAREIDAARTAQAGMRDRLAKTPLADIRRDPDLLRFAMAGGSVSFQTNCAPCHGRGAQGFSGYPNLGDDDWLWGGKIEDIHATILYGVRAADHKQTRQSQMPRYALDKLLTDDEINAVAEHVLVLAGSASGLAPERSSKDASIGAASDKGGKIFAAQCAACHGPDGKGVQEQGAPNLTDGIWLYGGSKSAIVESIRTGRGGQMPGWAGRLDAVALKSLAVYVHSLGGGK